MVGINVIISGFFVSVEKPSISTVISLGRGLVIVVLSLISMILIFGGQGIWMTTIVSEFICLILSLVFLKKNFSTLDSNLNKVA